MLSEEELQEQWLQWQSSLTKQTGNEYTLDDWLILIGIQEAGRPIQKELSEKEKYDLLQLGIWSILVPAKYFELIWVGDMGWPHFQQLKQLPNINLAERNFLLKKYVLLYNDINKLLKPPLSPIK